MSRQTWIQSSMKRTLAVLLVLGMILALVPVAAMATTEEPDLTVTFFGIGDYHGFLTSMEVDSGQGAADPGAPRFVGFMDALSAEIEDATGHAPIPLLSGDNYFGQPAFNQFLGEPGLAVANRIGVRYAALGNHEFSFSNRPLTESLGMADATARAAFLAEAGIVNPLTEILPVGHPLRATQPGIPFLAADVFLTGTDDRPDWVAPYAIIDDFYDDYGVTIGIIGLTGGHMPSTVGPADRQGLDFRMPGNVGVGYEWVEEMITELREEYGVAAVIALTHESGAPSNVIVQDLLNRGNAYFDGWFAAHGHAYTQNTLVYPVGATGDDIERSTEVVYTGHHGRGFGQIQLHFNEDGELEGTSRAIVGATNGNLVRAADPDPEVFQWVFGEGATWERGTRAAGAFTPGPVNLESSPPSGLDIAVDFTAVGDDPARWGWQQAAEGNVIGERGTWSRNQHTRNQYMVYLLHDYILRTTGEDLEEADAAGLIVMNNQSAWRGQDASRLQWGPEDTISSLDIINILPFENTLPLFEMRGRDVINLLNTPGHNVQPPGGDANAEVIDGVPNWGTMQGQTIAGAFLQDDVWYLSATLEPISNDGIYLFGASNHMFGGVVGGTYVDGLGYVTGPAMTGGQRMPLPGNTFGNAWDMEIINFEDGQTALNQDRYDLGPRFAMRDPDTGRHVTIQEAMALQAAYRVEQLDDDDDITSLIEVSATDDGTAAMEVWGFEARPDTPGNQSGWGAPALLEEHDGPRGTWSGVQTERDYVLNGAIVRVTATANDDNDDDFVGWFDGNDLVSEDLVYIFAADGDVALEARWHEEEQEPQFHKWFMQGNDRGEHGEFDPSGTITRGEVAAILIRIFAPESDLEAPPETPFTDIADLWEESYVAWAYYNDFIQGHIDEDGDRVFRPRDPVSREELAAMVARAADLTLTDAPAANFPDASQATCWAHPYINAVASVEWMRGDGEGNLRPTDSLQRAEVAAVVARALDRDATIDGERRLDLTEVEDDLRIFPDVAEGQWYFYVVIEVSHSHYFIEARVNVGTEADPEYVYVARWISVTWPAEEQPPTNGNGGTPTE
ncbi:MAG: S-layer homology domain-containing protein [Oscillospiraceae bacterium]|nr:S-layer homology domain-containing protein [Oscillospiraceae bacterium]